MSLGLWHYNLGTLYAKTGNFTEARYHFLMADFNGHSGIDLTKNKEIIESKLEVSRYEEPRSIIDYLANFGIFASYGLLNTISLSFVFFSFYLIWRKTNRQLIAFCIICSLGFILSGFWIKSWNKYMVTKPVALYDGPSSIFLTGQELPVGIMVVVSEKDDWLKIISPTRFEGWIKKNEMRKLK